jgi:uncharacterized protein (TIGR00290 family)
VPLALAWSGGKDSALALHALRGAGRQPRALLTTVTEGVERISIHGVRRELLHAQAAALGLPVVEVRIPLPCPNQVYEERMEQALARPPLDTVTEIAFGDLFLEDIRAYREQRLAPSGRRALFPVWGRNTGKLARTFVEEGFRAIVATVDPRFLDASFAGRAYDAQLLEDLPPTVDPCGENGEFHTFVHAGPLFDAPLAVETGVVVERDGFVYADIVPATGAGPARTAAA